MSFHDGISIAIDLDASRTTTGARAAGVCPQRSPAKPELDIRTKSASAPLRTDEDGVIFQEYDPLLKWQLQAAARVALGVFDSNQDYSEGHRLRICHRHVRYNPETRKANEVQVKHSDKSGKPYYSGVMTCGSVWACPVCAPKIQAVRAQEVRAAIDHWIAQGGSVVLLTQTVPHSKQDVLESLLERFTTALRKFKGQRAYTNAQKVWGISGSIRALEVTHGNHGWHPHAHTILFLQTLTPPVEDMKSDLFALWESAAQRAGFEGKLSREAFDVQDASKVKTYVTKMGTEYQWSAEHELVRAHSKRASGQSWSPFDLLHGMLDESRPDLVRLFAEYAFNFEGRRQLVWSNGLKKQLLGTEGPTDEQVAASVGESDPVLAYIPQDEWTIIRRHNLQGEVLRVVADYGRDGLRHLLSVYKDP